MITGNPGTGNVFINQEKLDPGPSQKLVNHSPDGFAWGYAGSGPAQLALALLLHYTDEATALEHYQLFKFQVVARLPSGQFSLRPADVKTWIATNTKYRDSNRKK